jgi:hypothetical protein
VCLWTADVGDLSMRVGREEMTRAAVGTVLHHSDSFGRGMHRLMMMAPEPKTKGRRNSLSSGESRVRVRGSVESGRDFSGDWRIDMCLNGHVPTSSEVYSAVVSTVPCCPRLQFIVTTVVGSHQSDEVLYNVHVFCMSQYALGSAIVLTGALKGGRAAVYMLSTIGQP